jgi:hypothetical protein
VATVSHREPPKKDRESNAFFLFRNACKGKAEYQKENAKMDLIKIKEAWRALPEHRKDVFQREAKENKEHYEAAFKEWASLNPHYAAEWKAEKVTCEKKRKRKIGFFLFFSIVGYFFPTFCIDFFKKTSKGQEEKREKARES